jgi:hypothetical protein
LKQGACGFLLQTLHCGFHCDSQWPVSYSKAEAGPHSPPALSKVFSFRRLWGGVAESCM